MIFQLKLLLTAVQFYTRIPVPVRFEYTDELLHRSTRYLPFIGWLTGGLAALLLIPCRMLFPDSLALLLCMGAIVLLTGAFHEDGFADFCDGMGGGYTREKRLQIMKDSCIGTYGSTGMTLMLALRYLSVLSLPPEWQGIGLLAGHSLSRLMPIGVIFTTAYARMEGPSKIKPIGQRGNASDLIVATVLGILPLVLLPLPAAGLLIPAVVLVTIFFRKYLISRLNGYTGDCLGALQQICEWTIYMVLVAFFRLQA